MLLISGMEIEAPKLGNWKSQPDSIYRSYRWAILYT